MMRALISPARLPVLHPSSMTTARCVRATDARIAVVVERAQDAQVDDLGVDARGRELLGRGERLGQASRHR